MCRLIEESRERKALLREAKACVKGEILKEVLKEARRKGRRGRGFQRFIHAVGRASGKVIKAALLRRVGLA